jgi:hypothetical protein
MVVFGGRLLEADQSDRLQFAPTIKPQDGAAATIQAWTRCMRYAGWQALGTDRTFIRICPIGAIMSGLRL